MTELLIERAIQRLRDNIAKREAIEDVESLKAVLTEIYDLRSALDTSRLCTQERDRRCQELEAKLAARPEVDANLVAEINTVWIHGCCQGHGEPVDDVATLTKRVRWIGSQLDCAQTNFRVTNAAYCKLDEETRALRSPQKPTALNPKAAWPFPEPRDTINGATSKVGGGTEHG